MFIGCWTLKKNLSKYIYIYYHIYMGLSENMLPLNPLVHPEFRACSSLPADQSCALLRARTWHGSKTVCVFCCWKSPQKGMDVDGMWNLVTLR